MGLFGASRASGPGRGAAGGFRFPAVPEWPLSQKLAYEKEVLGLYLSGHPMQAHAADAKRYASAALVDLERVTGTEEVRVMGLVVDVRVVRTRRNDKMAFVRVEDADRAVECVFFAEAYGRARRALEQHERSGSSSTRATWSATGSSGSSRCCRPSGGRAGAGS
jgi:DNA polymerase-3 subunit alpha